MPDPNENDETVEKKIETARCSAGKPQRLDPLGGFAADVPTPSPEDLDARQSRISERRRGGPPLPPGEEPRALLADPRGQSDEPTPVEPPDPEDE